MTKLPAEWGSMTEESRIYVYATEMVREYYSRLDIAGKSVLTITGSGDQILNAYFFGAKNVVGFDINKRAALFFDLKKACLKEFTYSEFLHFFGRSLQDGTFDKNLYAKIWGQLSEDAASFFDRMYMEIGEDGILQSTYFRQRPSLTRPIRDINAYLLDETEYEKMQGIVSKAKPILIATNIEELPKILENQKFDIINISNIPNYYVAGKEERVGVFLNLLTDLGGLLNPKGMIFFYAYSFGVLDKEVLRYTSRKETISELERLGLFDIKEEVLPAMEGEGNDRIIILSKK